MNQLTALFLSVLLCTSAAIAAPTPSPEVKQIPPPGIKVPDSERASLQAGVEELGKQIESLRQSLKDNPALLDLLPDVQIYHNAVRYALTYNEFYKPAEIKGAHVLLKEGMERARALSEGKTPWNKASGLIVRGYVSKIDGSVQPYGLVIPPGFDTDALRPRRLDLWYHGRGETLSETSFLLDREKSQGAFMPPETIVLHLYGRYCNANRFAGEVDTFEALDSVRRHYAIDPNRILVRGFSMGGGACWMFATHHAGLWAAAAPGAGFTETPHFLKIEDVNTVPWYQRKLWHMYDSIDYAVNLFNCPTIAYSGEIDPQRQAADEMAKAMEAVGLHLEQIIGPKTKHAYEPKAKIELAKRIDELADKGRNPLPTHIKFTTWTLKYNQMRWLQVDGLEHHWERANVEGEFTPAGQVKIITSNVTALTLTFPSGNTPFNDAQSPSVILDGQQFSTSPAGPDGAWTGHFRKSDGKWAVVSSLDDGVLRKRHDLQGPIDDAFMDSFIMVKPTGKPMNDKTATWVDSEMNRAITQWRSVYRGEARVKDDSAIDNNDIASSNLILWGDPSSNAILKKIADKLPIQWNAETIVVGDKKFPSASQVPAMIYPNPLNPKHYVVLNSGVTFREYDLMNNDRQNSKLPDWAVIDTTIPISPEAPGGISGGGFFDEEWKLGRKSE
jgi:acetyl esterase/lipase